MRRLFLFSLMTLLASGAAITSSSTATDLIGGTVTVTRFGGTMSSATFVAGLGGSVIAASSGSAGFELTVTAGDTSLSTWTLTNTDASIIFLNRITAVSIDLTVSTGGSLFDNGSTPSSPGSLTGVPGVTYVGGITIDSATEVNPWLDPLNTGDMFRATNMTFGLGFTALASSSWMDDTDSTKVPEPSSAFLLAGGLLWMLVSISVHRRSSAA